FKPEFADADAAEGAGTGGGKTVNDPHAFQSIANAKIYVKNIADAFCAADSAGCDTYKANAAAYTQKLDALEGEVTAAIQAIPEAKRVVITSHPRLIEQIASETGIKVGGTLYSDALSPPDGPASTYIDMMHNNIEQFKGALLGS
ncbi:MAG: metal ABC transporter substrate-binding protein, partial [Mesorhizobium sp.]